MPAVKEYSIYLLAQDTSPHKMPVVSHLELADKPIVSIEDVVSYTRDTHEIELVDEALERISKLDVPVDGRVFVVCIDRDPIYWGAFWTPISSMAFDGVVIVKPSSPKTRVVQIQLGYPSANAFTGTDPRSSEEILQALARAGKLR